MTDWLTPISRKNGVSLQQDRLFILRRPIAWVARMLSHDGTENLTTKPQHCRQDVHFIGRYCHLPIRPSNHLIITIFRTGSNDISSTTIPTNDKESITNQANENYLPCATKKWFPLCWLDHALVELKNELPSALLHYGCARARHHSQPNLDCKQDQATDRYCNWWWTRTVARLIGSEIRHRLLGRFSNLAL